MQDIATVDTSLEVKRRDLTAKIVEGRRAIAVLVERHGEMGRRIAQATEAVAELERNLAATNTVMDLIGREGLALGPTPVGRQTAAAAPAPQPPTTITYPARKPEPFRPMAFLRCLTEGHDMVTSRSMASTVTCRRCKMRRTS